MEKKKQHTVPACYLENFTDGTGKVYIRRADTVYAAKPDNVLTRNSFYTLPIEGGGASNFLEDDLANLEGQYAELFREKLGPKLPLTWTDRELLSVFIAAMMLRTKAFRAGLKQTLDQAHEHVEEVMSYVRSGGTIVSAPSASTGQGYPAHDLLKLREDLPSCQAAFLFGQIQRATNIVFHMKWRFCVAPSGYSFVTSDSPVNWANPDLLSKHGSHGMRNLYWLCHDGAELTMALSRDMVWLGGWKLQAEDYVMTSPSIAAELNERSIRGAHEEVVGPDRAYLEGLTYGDVEDRPE